MDPSLSALHDLLLRSQHEARAGKPNSEGQSSASSLFLDMQTQRTLGALPSTSCFGSKGLSAEAQCAGTRPVDRGFRVFGWNLGGCSADTLCDLVKTATREAVFDSDLFLLQELPRSRTGWATTTTKEGYRLVGHQGSSQWRGTGLLYSPLAWSVIRRVAKGKGTWFLLKSLRSSVQFWVATFHFTPGLTVQKHEQEVLEFLKGRPSDGRPVLLQGDSNAHLGWVAGSGAVEALGLEGKSIMMLDQFSAAGIRLCPPPSRQFPTPTSRPRREGCEGHQIDFGATKGVPLYIHEDSYMLQGTDHELLELRFWLRLAAQCTRPRPSKCFRDPRAVKEAFRRAKTSRSPAAWKTALRLRREARRSWESARIRRATEGDWQAFRDETRVQATGWDLVYADAQACDPHQSVHQHLTEVYSGDDLPPLPPFVGPVQAFSIEELTKAVSQIRKGKSVGVDLTSRELLDGILQTTGGPEHLLEFMNRTLCTQTVPRDWNRPLVIMLAKTDSPTAPSDLRPIAVGSSAAKLFSRLLVNRIAPKLAPRTHSQCASSGRQTCDVVCSLWKLCELEREWKAGLGVVKVDVRKAFDSVNRAALLAALRARLGDTAEYRCFHALLVDVEAVLQTCWGSSLLAMKSGIKQGSIESPILFSFLMEVALEQARVKSSWDQGSHLFHDMLEEDLLYMDDGYLWGPDCRTLGVRLGQLAEVLQGFGLTLNIAKCVLYCSPYCPGPHKLRLHRVTLEASDHLPVMGLKMRVGMSMSELIQPLLSRARSKFWGLKHLFRSKTQAKGRVQLMHRVISNTALWCIAALPPDRPALALVNSFQALLLTWLLRLGKRADEDWPAFRKRAVRSARYSLHVAGCPRWSTCWLTRWWTFAGHRVRASQQQFPPISTILEMFRDRQWWQKAKDAGLSHPERFFARLHSLDKAMDTVCGGPWRVYALDRAAWQAKLSTWIQQRDLPWATERVIPMCDRHPGFGAFYMYFLLPALGTILPFFAQLPGVLAPIPDDYGNWPPIWFTEATLRGRDLAARGLRMSDALAMLARTASHRNFATYTNFASRAAVAIGNTLELPVSNLAPEEIHLDLRVWVTFVEAHILEEFLEHEYPFQQGLYEGLRNVNPNLASLPAPPQETMLRAQRREEFNQLRRDPPFIRHLRASTGPAFRSHSLMRLEWVGRCVGDFHDLYHAGYNLHGVFEEMVAFIRARDNGSYRSLALPYYREVLSQLGTFLGSPDSSRPPQASEWVADRESELWYLYNYHGLKARDVDVDDISVGNASSSNRSCAEEAADDVSSLMDRKGVNKRWLKNAPTRRRRAPSRPRTPHASTTPRSLNRPSAPTTTERVNLSAMAKHKCRGTPMPATTRPTPKARPAARAPLPRSEKPTHRSPPQASREQGASRDMPASSSEAAGAGGTGPDGPLTVEEALDTWLLLLGVRDIDEPIGTDVLPERVTTAIVETFLEHNLADRLTFTMAVNRLLGGLLSAIGAALEDDESIYMQTSIADALQPRTGTMPAAVWENLLQKFQRGLEDLPKGLRAVQVEHLLSWLDYRCTRAQEGFLLGHLRDEGAQLLAVLVAFRDQNLAAVSEQEPFCRSAPLVAWLMGEVVFEIPVMLFPKPLPDSDSDNIPNVTEPLPATLPAIDLDTQTTESTGVLAVHAEPGSGWSAGQLRPLGEAPPPDLEDSLEESRQYVDLLAADEQEARHDRLVEEQRLRREQDAIEAEESQQLQYLEGLQEENALATPSAGVGRKRRILVVEMSTGSQDEPRTARCIRLPISEDGIATMTLRLWRDDEPDQDLIPTPVLEPSLPAAPVPPTQLLPATLPGDSGEVADDNIAINFAEYQEVFQAWANGRMSTSQVLALHGRGVLSLLESQWAFMADDTCAAEARLAALPGGPGSALPPVGAGCLGSEGDDSQEAVDTLLEEWEVLFSRWKGGLLTTAMVERELGGKAVSELYRRWQVYMDGATAYADGQRGRSSGDA
ncbi:RTase, partial [Symbiodinium sp. CCMP2592]